MGFFRALARMLGLDRARPEAAAGAAPRQADHDAEGDEEDAADGDEDQEDAQSPVRELGSILYAFVASLWPQRPEVHA